MAVQIKYIKVSELKDYVNSDEFKGQSFDTISHLRAQSHAKNPRADAEDVALTLAYDDEKLVGYLGTLPDRVFVDGKEYKIGWYSCMWVLPDYRRSGIAKMLIVETLRLYKNQIMITNYHPLSKAAFQKNDQFREIVLLKGVRAYLRFDLSRIILRKKPGLSWAKPILWFMDDLGNLFAGAWFSMKRYALKHYQIRQVKEISSELSLFIEKALQASPFRRSGEEFSWLLNYPWVKNENENEIDPSRYYFSQFDPVFKQWMLEIRNKEGQLKGAALLCKHKGELKTHYLLTEPEVIPDLFRHIYRLMRIEKISTLVSHSELFIKEVEKHKNSFITQRPSEYGFMATPYIEELLGDDPGDFFEGDGDSMFT